MITCVQSVQNDGNASPLTLTLPAATTAGNCLVAAIGTEASSVNPSVAGVTVGGSADNFTSLLSAGTGSDEAVIGIWGDPDCAGGQTALSVSFSGGTGTPYLFAAVYEFSGLPLTTGALLDKSSSVVNGHSAGWSSGNTPTTSYAEEAWVGIVMTDSVTVTGPSSPWVNGAQLTNTDGFPAGVDFMSGYKIVSGTAAAAYSGSLSVAQYYCAGIVTLAPAGGVPASSGLLMSAFA